MTNGKDGRTILLVEDELIISLAESKALQAVGYKVLQANTGEKAVQAATKDRAVDLILMDIDLGSGIDGTEAARQILRIRKIPIVFLTSHSEREMVERVKGITRYGYVIKNSGNFVLQSSIEMAFELFEAHEKVYTSESRQKALLQGLPELAWLKDPNGVYLFCNPEFEKLYGAAEESIIGKTDYDFVDKDLADYFRANDSRAIKTGKPCINEEWVTFSHDGHRALLETIKTPMLDAEGRLVGVLGTARDITDRKRIEEALIESETKYRNLVETSLTGIYIIQDDLFRFVNKRFCEIFGYSYEEIVDKMSPRDTTYPEDWGIVAESIRKRLSGEIDSVEYEFRAVKKDGTIISVKVMAIKLNYRGRPATMGTIIDITDKKKTEIELLQSNLQKELLLKEMQHRMKNTLSFVSSLLSLEKTKFENVAAHSVFDDLISRLRTIGQVYQQLYEHGETNTVDLSCYIKKMTEQLQETCRGPFGKIRFSDSLIPVEIEMKRAINIGLIVNELFTNAVKYAYEPGTEGTVNVKLEKTDGGICLSVSDHGKGFDASQTTRGLGLQIIALLAKQLNAAFSIENRNGTIATLRLTV